MVTTDETPITLYSRLVALKCPYDDTFLAEGPQDPVEWDLTVVDAAGLSSAVTVQYDPALAGQPFILTVSGHVWEFSFAPDGGIDRARHGARWALESPFKEQLLAELVAGIQPDNQEAAL